MRIPIDVLMSEVLPFVDVLSLACLASTCKLLSQDVQPLVRATPFHVKLRELNVAYQGWRYVIRVQFHDIYGVVHVDYPPDPMSNTIDYATVFVLPPIFNEQRRGHRRAFLAKLGRLLTLSGIGVHWVT